ncbi:MAG: hypothetical protein ACKO0X_00765 [Bacteroidota bacterium]
MFLAKTRKVFRNGRKRFFHIESLCVFNVSLWALRVKKIIVSASRRHPPPVTDPATVTAADTGTGTGTATATSTATTTAPP